jgi:hypothetical protein
MTSPHPAAHVLILDRATELLRRRGCRALTMEAVARELGVSKNRLFFTVFLAGANALMRAENLDRFRLHPAAMAARLASLLFDGIAPPTRKSRS